MTDDELKRLAKDCAGSLFRSRHEALVRLMTETGMCAGEVLSLQINGVDLTRGLVTVRRGKVGKGEIGAFGPQSAQALNRFIRFRRDYG